MIGPKIRVSEHALRLHRESLVLDCHTHFLINGWLFKRKFHESGPRPLVYNPFHNELDLHSALAGGVKAIAFTSYIMGWPWLKGTDRYTASILDRYFDIVDECSGSLVHCTTPEEIRAAVAAGKIAAFPAIEGAHVLEGKLENLSELHRRGVRLVTLTHFLSNGIADGTTSPYRPIGGLSRFGREVLHEMERLGMMVDVAHCTRDAFFQVLEVAQKPVIYSHGALRRYKDIERNLADDQVRALASAGGLFGLIFFPKYLGSSGYTIRAVARQAADIAEMVGPRCICVGSDMDGTTYTPIGFRDASDWPQLTQALLDAGFNDTEVNGILGENFLRFFESTLAQS